MSSSGALSMEAKLQLLVDTWVGKKANSLLSKPCPSLLPHKGPVRKLLTATRRSLPRPEDINADVAVTAVAVGAVKVLGQVVHWLQQHPCSELQGAPAKDLPSSDWNYLMEALQLMVSACVHLPQLEVKEQCKRQLEASGKIRHCPYQHAISSMLSLLPT